MVLFKDNVIVITHNDLDGVGSPIVSKNFGIDADVHYVNNGMVDSAVEKAINDINVHTGSYTLLICDHSPSHDAYKLLVDNDIDFYIFDHHKSSELLDVKDDRIIIDTTKCATKLFFDFMMENYADKAEEERIKFDLHWFVFCVNDWDMWHHTNPQSTAINTLLYEIGIPSFVDRFFKDPCIALKENEQKIVSLAFDRKKDYIDLLDKHLVIKDKDYDFPYGVVFNENYAYTSEAGNDLIKRNNLKFIYLINPLLGKVSLRSVGDFDVSLTASYFAKMFGTSSGGHKNAAGFGIGWNQVGTLLEEILYR